jgi:hypothetical protein
MVFKQRTVGGCANEGWGLVLACAGLMQWWRRSQMHVNMNMKVRAEAVEVEGRFHTFTHEEVLEQAIVDLQAPELGASEE